MSGLQCADPTKSRHRSSAPGEIEGREQSVLHPTRPQYGPRARQKPGYRRSKPAFPLAADDLTYYRQRSIADCDPFRRSASGQSGSNNRKSEKQEPARKCGLSRLLRKAVQYRHGSCLQAGACRLSHGRPGVGKYPRPLAAWSPGTLGHGGSAERWHCWRSHYSAW
jgi:hypothetical protein